MIDQLEQKITNICVAKLINSSAIQCAPLFILVYFSSQFVSLRQMQRPPRLTNEKRHYIKAIRASEIELNSIHANIPG